MTPRWLTRPDVVIGLLSMVHELMYCELAACVVGTTKIQRSG